VSLFTKLFRKGKKNINLQVTEMGEEKPEPKPEGTGTTLRKPEESPAPPHKKEGPELTALEMAQKKDWEVKTLPVWKPGDVILDTYEVEDVISGGMGHVYIANHNKWKVKLAIKSPNEMMLAGSQLMDRAGSPSKHRLLLLREKYRRCAPYCSGICGWRKPEAMDRGRQMH